MNDLALPRDALITAVRALPDNGLAAGREAALERFLQRGFPSTRIEDWKYTDLGGVADVSRRWLDNYAVAPAPASAADTISEICRSLEAHWIVILNGVPQEILSLPEGVTISTSATTKLLSRDSALADLNSALLEEGVHIRVSGPAGNRPLGILCYDVADGQPLVTQTRVDIEVEAGASIDVIEYHASSGDADHYANAIVDIVLREDAAATLVRIQDRDNGHSQTHQTAVRLADRSRMYYSGFDLGGRMIRNDLSADLAGQDADVDIGGLYIAGDGQHIDNHIRVDHAAGPARSSQQYRGVLGGKCRCVWNGKAVVQPGADGTDAEQGNHNLLLSDQAEIDAKPELEIYADEVKCAHGTTVGQLDEDALFYLRTRGLDEQEARNALTHAFGASIVSRVEGEALTGLLTAMVDKRLDRIAEGDSA